MRIDEKSADKLEKILNLAKASLEGDEDLSEAMWEIQELSEDLTKALIYEDNEDY